MRAGSAWGVLLVTAVVATACSGDPVSPEGRGEAGGGRGQSPGVGTEPPDGEDLFDRVKRISSGACTPGRNAASHLSGIGFFCLPFDAIPAVDDPTFVPAGEATFVPDVEPVVAVDIKGRERAYPIRILITHEIVNDRIAGEPIVVSFCPLCNSAVAFSRRTEGRTLTFGVSGQLLSSNLVMFDRETVSLWQQVTGKAFNGEFRGSTLRRLPVQMVDFGTWKAANPKGVVMEEPIAGFDYGRDPYASHGRDPNEESKFFRPPPESDVDIRTDPRLPPKWRVLGVQRGRSAVAFPVPEARTQTAIATARLKGIPLVAFFRRGTAEPSTAGRLEQGRRGWSGTVYRGTLEGRRLFFRSQKQWFIETSTDSRFDLFGTAVSGPLEGKKLKPVRQVTAFWFSWVDAYPKTKVARP